MPENTIAELVDNLFKTHLKPDGREYSYNEISRMTQNQLSPTYLGKLRRGAVPNPGRNALLLLCQAFQVPSSYFFPELGEEQSELADEELDRTLAQRTANLTPERKRRLAELIKLFLGE